MRTECNPRPMRFARLKGRDVVADFGGGAMTSDAGVLLLGATDRAIGLVDRFAGCFSDGRSAGRVVHDVATLVGQRVRCACTALVSPCCQAAGAAVSIGWSGLRLAPSCSIEKDRGSIMGSRSSFTDAALEEVSDWQNRPLDGVYPEVFFDALRVKIRDEGLVRNKAVYLALAITCQSEKEVLSSEVVPLGPYLAFRPRSATPQPALSVS